MSWLRALSVLALASASSACVSYAGVRFAAASPDMELRGEANDLQARIAVAWRGVEERDGTTEFRFRVRVENPGATPFMLVPAEFELLDAALTSFGLARVENPPAAVEAGQAATLDLAFPVAAEGGLEAYDLTSLTLHTRFQGRRWSWSTTFQRVAEPEHGSPFSFGFGINWVFD